MSAPRDVTFQDIYNELLAGKKLGISFASVKEAEGFRIRMHQFKTREEASQIAVGLIAQEDVSKFVFKMIPPYGEPVDNPVKVEMSFTPKSSKTFKVIELETPKPFAAIDVMCRLCKTVYDKSLESCPYCYSPSYDIIETRAKT